MFSEEMNAVVRSARVPDVYFDVAQFFDKLVRAISAVVLLSGRALDAVREFCVGFPGTEWRLGRSRTARAVESVAVGAIAR